MKMQISVSLAALLVATTWSLPVLAQSAPASGENDIGKLESITVTAQKRAEDIEVAPLAITAVSGVDIAENRILTTEDLGHSTVGLSFTATSPQAQEINIRGITNTRLTAPTADQSVSTFVDEVYVSRSGTMNMNFYDLDRIEIIRGPQGVLLGKNVAGGALSVITASPKFEPSAEFSAGIGSYDLRQATAYVTGPLSDSWAGRVAFQAIDHAGYARDLAHNVDLENLDSVQGRGQLLYQSKDSDFRAHLTFDYSKDDSNGPNRVPVASPNCLPAPCVQPWSKARNKIAGLVPGLTPRESFPTWPTFLGDGTPTAQDVFHESVGAILKLEKGVAEYVTLTSVTGYRGGHANTFYDQSGIGPTNPYNVDALLLFAEPVYFQEQVRQYSEELRLTSSYPSGFIDWIAGAYFQRVNVHQFNRFWGEGKYLPTLSGQSNWDDHGTSEDYAAFAQLGFKLGTDWKLDVGARYSHDKKSGNQTGTAIATGDRFHPNDPAPLTPLAVVPGFTTPYGQSWSKVTPQATLTWKPYDGLMSYLTASTGFKGGGFQNNAPKAYAASTPYNPETVYNYELGVKLVMLGGRARWNNAVFDEEYKNLQVQQTSGACLCNIINNASSATIRGIESEFQIQATHSLYFYISGSYLDDKYNVFVDTNGVNNTGHKLQRTPNYQASVGAELTAPVGSWGDALHFRASFKQQGKMFWAPDNYTWEPSYGLLDARISLAPVQKPWTVSVWGKNLGNTLYRTSIIAIFGDEISSYGAPRTYGVEFSSKF